MKILCSPILADPPHVRRVLGRVFSKFPPITAFAADKALSFVVGVQVRFGGPYIDAEKRGVAVSFATSAAPVQEFSG
jgi:hypothetical protein